MMTSVLAMKLIGAVAHMSELLETLSLGSSECSTLSQVLLMEGDWSC